MLTPFGPPQRTDKAFMLLPRHFRTLVACAAIFATTSVFAQSKPSTQHDASLPIEIAADTLEVRQDQNLAIFSGNVQAQQGAIRLKAEMLQVHYRPQQGEASVQGAISRIDAKGKVFFSSPGQTAQGDSGVYDVDKSLITMLGNVVLTRDNNVIRGNRLLLNLATGRSKVEGIVGKSGGRVRGLFVPNKKPKK